MKHQPLDSPPCFSSSSLMQSLISLFQLLILLALPNSRKASLHIPKKSLLLSHIKAVFFFLSVSKCNLSQYLLFNFQPRGTGVVIQIFGWLFPCTLSNHLGICFITTLRFLSKCFCSIREVLQTSVLTVNKVCIAKLSKTDSV